MNACQAGDRRPREASGIDGSLGVVIDVAGGPSESEGVGAFAGLVSSFVRTPIERVKTVMQIQHQGKTKAPYSNSLVCAYRLARNEGLRHGLFEGL